MLIISQFLKILSRNKRRKTPILRKMFKAPASYRIKEYEGNFSFVNKEVFCSVSCTFYPRQTSPAT